MLEEKKKTVQVVKFDAPFTFQGNMNGIKVTKVNQALGDGDIYSYKSRTECEVNGSVRIEGQKLTAEITYYVWEDDYGPKKPKSDKLMMKGVKTCDLNELFGGLATRTESDTHKTTTIKKSWKVRSDIGNARYRAYYNGSKSDYMYIDFNDYPSINNAGKKEWLPLDQIRVKIDGSGSELNGQGNIGIQGRIVIYFELTTETTYTYKSSQTYDKAKGSLVRGRNPVLTSIPENVRTVLGRGYNIKGNYADTDSVTLPVVDVKKVNDNGLLMVSNNSRMNGRTVKGESKEEISSSYESELNVSVSASGFGATFSNETKKTLKKEKSFNEGRKYIWLSKVLKSKIYKADTTPSTAGFASLLSDTFINDLNTKTADQIIRDYGTHVMLGAVIGARLTYSMSYVKSIEKMSISKSFSNTTSVVYNQSPLGGLVDKVKAEKEQNGENTNEKSSVELVFKALNDKNVSAEKIKQIKELLKYTKNNTKPATNKKSASGSGSLSASLTAGYSVNTSESSTFENESMEESCTVVGGNMALENRICGDLSAINTWEDSLNSSNTNYWADFENGTLYPIYECVPAGHKVTASALKTAWEKYLSDENAEKECGRTVITQRFSIQGSNESVHRLSGDREINSSDGKLTAWVLYMEPVNIDGGNVAIAVQLTVGESGLNSGRSLLCLHEVVAINKSLFPRIAIDSTKVKNVSYRVQGSVYKSCHGLFDITYLVRDCPFLDTTSNTVSISIDGNGDNDSKHLKVVGVFKLPVIGYDK